MSVGMQKNIIIRENKHHLSMKRFYESRQKKPTACIPFQSMADILDKQDSWRTWSCIRLAHLLKDAAVIQAITATNRIMEMKNWRRENGLKRRGRYLTRRQGKYCWQNAIEAVAIHNEIGSTYLTS